jgi:putative phage-type endonuclease
MNVQTFESEEEWLAGRRGKITGSRLKDIYSKRGTTKIGFYEILAERLGLPADDENVMDRGHRLEDEAVDRFEAKTGKKVDRSLVIWSREDCPEIAVSPDGSIGEKEAVEIKCLSSARHLEALITGSIPSEYEEQVIQYFIVNDKLKTLYFCFYDPRMKVNDFFIREVTRESLADQIETMLNFEKITLAQIENLVTALRF